MKPHEKIENIEDRNARVEAEKAWETSWTRRIIIALMTYVVMGLYMKWLGIEQPWQHAIVPPVAYIFSTLGLSIFKGIWIQNIYKGENT